LLLLASLQLLELLLLLTSLLLQEYLQLTGLTAASFAATADVLACCMLVSMLLIAFLLSLVFQQHKNFYLFSFLYPKLNKKFFFMNYIVQQERF
jgi:hypothetical protein